MSREYPRRGSAYPRRSRLGLIAGFVTPMGFEGSKITEFLLVPFVGACIHVPPPPANQIVYVVGFGAYRADGGLLYPVWVTGTLRAQPLETGLADVGYRLAKGRGLPATNRSGSRRRKGCPAKTYSPVPRSLWCCMAGLILQRQKRKRTASSGVCMRRL